VNKETIDEIEQLAKESGGVFFICILDRDYENEKPVIIRDYGSPVFYFNIENPAYQCYLNVTKLFLTKI
jgi:hypothetical protein